MQANMTSRGPKAAAALQAISLESPIKSANKTAFVIDDARRSSSPDSELEKDAQDLELRQRFVGEVDLPESALVRFHATVTPSSRLL
jgi:hypothetical protein